jgi:hypothetical protein
LWENCTDGGGREIVVVVVFGQFCIFSLLFVWLVAGVNIMGLRFFFFFMGVGRECVSDFSLTNYLLQFPP